MKRKILLVDDEVAVLLTLKAVLEISGYEVDTAASAREAKSKLKKRDYVMVITDMRMESDAAGKDVIRAARSAEYHPAVALLTAFPVAEEDWQEMGADNMLVKPMHTRVLIEQIAALLAAHETRLEQLIVLRAAHDERMEKMLAEHEMEIAAIRSGRLVTKSFPKEQTTTRLASYSNRPTEQAAETATVLRKISGNKTSAKKAITKRVTASTRKTKPASKTHHGD